MTWKSKLLKISFSERQTVVICSSYDIFGVCMGHGNT